MLKKSLIIFATAALACAAHAQTTPAKKELVGRILKLQQPGIEAMARQLAEEPAAELMERAGAALPQRVAADKQEAVAKEIQADLKRYSDETVPMVRDRAVKIAPETIGPILEQKFSESELRQVANIIENPVYQRFQALGPDMQKALAEKLINDTRPQVEPRIRALEQNIAKRLGIPQQPAAPGK